MRTAGGPVPTQRRQGEAEPQAGSAPASLLSEEDILREAGAAFSDGINTGFYINSYTTKQCPTLEGVLEEMRRGLERLQDQAVVLKERQASSRANQANADEQTGHGGAAAGPA